ncbi:MAG: tRNA epoxyqueuosine(34) reductase QueG, partial [Gammaproteobacteria bacterium]
MDEPGRPPAPADFVEKIREWGQDLGFQQIGVTGIELEEDERRLQRWLDKKRHGEMRYMAKHGTKRSRPSELVEKTISVISARMNYLS